MKPTVDTFTQQPSSTQGATFDNRMNIKPFGVIAMLIFVIGGFAFIMWRDTPKEYKLSICNGSKCTNSIVNSIKVDDRKITIYIDRHTNRVKEVLLLNINQTATVTPIYR